MAWLVTAAVIVGGTIALIGAALTVLCIREEWHEGGLVEMPGGETIFDPPPQREGPLAHVSHRWPAIEVDHSARPAPPLR